MTPRQGLVVPRVSGKSRLILSYNWNNSKLFAILKLDLPGGAVPGEKEYQKIIIFFANFIQTLGEQLKLRQQVIATATVYFKRFYSQNTLNCVDPLLLAPTAIFLASKVRMIELYASKHTKSNR